MNSKILSICIPTYNRARFLNNLLLQISEFSDSLKSKIEICISDNASTDETQTIISRWSAEIEICAVTQPSNIGLSGNFRAVAGLATSPWAMLMGDDDSYIVENLERLLATLGCVHADTLILCNIRNPDATRLLEGYAPGQYSAKQIRSRILANGLDAFGFLSMYVLPRSSLERFRTMTEEQLFGWPHLAIFMMEISKVDIHVLDECVVNRLADHGEITQTWRRVDWIQIMMRKTKLCCANPSNGDIFNNLLALREYVRWNFVREVFAARLEGTLPATLRTDAKLLIGQTNISYMMKKILISFVGVMAMFPVTLMSVGKKIRNRRRVKEVKTPSRDEKSVTDGMKRGL